MGHHQLTAEAISIKNSIIKVKVKFVPVHYAMKAYGGVDV
jgi:hypothetical protein